MPLKKHKLFFYKVPGPRSFICEFYHVYPLLYTNISGKQEKRKAAKIIFMKQLQHINPNEGSSRK